MKAEEVTVHVVHPRRTDIVYWHNNRAVDATRRHWLYYCGCCGYDGLLSLENGADCKACGCVVVSVSVAKHAPALQAIASHCKPLQVKAS